MVVYKAHTTQVPLAHLTEMAALVADLFRVEPTTVIGRLDMTRRAVPDHWHAHWRQAVSS
jgi:hypothetical protein